MKQIGSAITTLRGDQSSKTGTPHGERGLQTQSNSQVAAWLARQTPRDMDKAAVSRALQHNVALQVKYEGRYPSGPNGERLPSYDVAVDCAIDGTAADRAAAKEDLLNFISPAPVREIEGWLAELSVITASRQREGIEATLMLSAYASRLAQYPADIVRHVLLKKTWKFWPTWDELSKQCEAMASPRLHMIAALSRPPVDPEPERREATQDERDRIAALVAEQFPSIPQEMRDRAVAEVVKGKCMEGGSND